MVVGDAADGAWSVLVTFLVVSYWRGGWLLQDFYGCSQPLAFCSADAAEHEASGLASELWGLGIALAAILSRHQLARCCRRAPARVGSFLAVAHTAALGTASISAWRGCWYLSDAWLLLPGQLSPREYSFWASHVAGSLALARVGALASAMAAPAVFLSDAAGAAVEPAGDAGAGAGGAGGAGATGVCWPWSLLGPAVLLDFACEPPLLLATRRSRTAAAAGPAAVSGSSGRGRGADGSAPAAAPRSACNGTGAPPLPPPPPPLCLDLLLSAGVVAHAVVSFWRGLWSLIDHYEWAFSERPADLRRTAWLSTALGLAVFALEMLRGQQQQRGCWLLPASGGGGRLAQLARLYVLAFGSVNTWRGFWYLWDAYHEVSLLSAWVSHALGFLGLAAIGASRSVLASPVVIALDCDVLPSAPTMGLARAAAAAAAAAAPARESSEEGRIVAQASTPTACSMELSTTAASSQLQL